ncbi:N-acetylmannosamine-6-phosphate 2-epimerase [Jeotgalibacillus terrae]|uniref:Putative N-acetylmannosamine-6-phosphate 2-epimerase n=1 Tax=Jeotgalibacillus terrae TaxID=587735 RepID=A0ABW5ZDS1_9BACL|nr:N-acetylmannosamine-6-phosphate 2-epimerase [Jeotgalibacillus terrae]MBM7580129.1 N-acylglucosamine-6-phosphate 2-epimerase [Jeotgalibacillus terrae]
MTCIIPDRSLVVSCQALEDEPLHGSDTMVKMAFAAMQGGAAGIRANGIEDIKAISKAVDLPVIGLLKKDYPGNDIYITPTLEDALLVSQAGADIVALDATDRVRPDGRSLSETIGILKSKGILVMADISTFEEGIKAASFGVDFVSTTLSGYTPYSKALDGPDLDLVTKLANVLDVPLVAEGRISTPDEAVSALNAGAYFVVVGGAITRPQQITKKFTEKIQERQAKIL